MAVGPTKHWLTPKRLARGLEAAERELKRWHMSPEDARRYWREHAGGFRPAVVEGDPKFLRADARARLGELIAGKEVLTAADVARVQKRDDATGAPYMYKDKFYTPLFTPRFILFSIAALGGGYLIGRWWKRRASSARTHVAGEYQYDRSKTGFENLLAHTDYRNADLRSRVDGSPSSTPSPYLASLALDNL